MITGTFPHQNHVSGNDFVGRTEDESADQQIKRMQSIARTLVKRLGYRAYQTGKWWGGPHDFGGFTEGDTMDSVTAGTAPSQYTGTRPSYANQGRHGDWGLMIGRVDYVNDIQSPAHPINYANTIAYHQAAVCQGRYASAAIRNGIDYSSTWNISSFRLASRVIESKYLAQPINTIRQIIYATSWVCLREP